MSGPGALQWHSVPQEFEYAELPDPRPIDHGYEAIDWTKSPLYRVYGIPGNDQSIPLTTNPRRS